MEHGKWLLIAAVSGLSANLQAQQQEITGLEVGGFELLPSFEYQSLYDDNLTRSDTAQTDSWASVYRPGLLLRNQSEVNPFRINYLLSHADYYSSSEDNYTDHYFSALLGTEINRRHRLRLQADFTDGHDDRGTAYSIGRGDELSEPDTYTRAGADVIYSYGLESATGRLELNAGVSELDYDGDALNYQARDRQTSRYGGAFYYRVGPSTDLLLDASQAHIRYDLALDPQVPLDSDERSLLLGARWEGGANTRGFAKVGYQEKDFAAAQRQTFHGLDWEVGVTWQPLSYSQLELSTELDSRETNGAGDFIKSRDYQIRWQHDWVERLGTSLTLRHRDNEYVGSPTLREDDNRLLQLSTVYQFRRWLSFELAYRHDERDSTVKAIEYDRNQYRLAVSISM
ncbi:outer membrane beta-barrel protein [Bowmanella dokdonensis]|uniref:Outer membrane beta-barrel protein n=1 Tax=Bowmanella dokdonensis TaxID=751969 RepID=A0A939IQL4_9ALTE|nr:outer membrane beta-barrel protein [Bowmanella dokdonensis]MBN7824702.1 outer membrane beta-barrel protein [Bowmanella dokdonensis]